MLIPPFRNEIVGYIDKFYNKVWPNCFHIFLITPSSTLVIHFASNMMAATLKLLVLFVFLVFKEASCCLGGSKDEKVRHKPGMFDSTLKVI